MYFSPITPYIQIIDTYTHSYVYTVKYITLYICYINNYTINIKNNMLRHVLMICDYRRIILVPYVVTSLAVKHSSITQMNLVNEEERQPLICKYDIILIPCEGRLWRACCITRQVYGSEEQWKGDDAWALDNLSWFIIDDFCSLCVTRILIKCNNYECTCKCGKLYSLKYLSNITCYALRACMYSIHTCSA